MRINQTKIIKIPQLLNCLITKSRATWLNGYIVKLLYCYIAILLIFLFAPASAYAAKLTLDPADLTVTSGEQFTVNLSLDTEGKTVNSLDVAFIYPQNLVWIDKVDYTSLFPFHVQKITKDEGKAILHFGADSQGTRFTGQGLLASLTLSTHNAGQSYLSFVCDNSNDNDDTNIWEADNSADLIDCGGLHKGIYHINPKVGGVPGSPTPKPVCLPPQAPTGLQATSGPARGQVTLSWNKAENADYYTVTYGLASRGYIWGAPNIGKGTEYSVSQLFPGKVYYFVLTSVNSCGSSGYSAEIAVRAGGSLPASPPPEEKGGWQPGEVITFSPLPLVSPWPEATPSATPEATPEESPTAFVPPKAEPFWRNWSFWAKAGALSVILFVLLLIVSGLKSRFGKPPFPEAEEKAVSVGEEPSGKWPPPPVGPSGPRSSGAEEISVQSGEAPGQGKPAPFSSDNVGI